MASIRRNVEFEYWADRQSLKAIMAAEHVVAGALSMVAHIVAISDLWAARVEGATPQLDPWPSFTAAEAQSELLRLRDRWFKLCDCIAVEVQVHYRSSGGQNCANRFDEVIQEVLLHGAHHRGQIALLLRMNGCEPPRSTDFIPALRTQEFV